MGYNPGIPDASDSPANFPAQAQVNWSRLQTIVEADHQFNINPAATDGYHNLVHMLQPVPDPSGANAGVGRLFVKLIGGVVHLFYMDDAGKEYQISPTMPIRAAVNFTPTNANPNQPTVNSAFNVDPTLGVGVTGNYAIGFTINFLNAMPDSDYMVYVTAFGKTSLHYGSVSNTATYINSKTANLVKVNLDSGSNATIWEIYVMVFSVT